ncbi:hypothetical protein DERP_007969, partial [Dermatophagoides pteronyssinus]
HDDDCPTLNDVNEILNDSSSIEPPPKDQKSSMNAPELLLAEKVEKLSIDNNQLKHDNEELLNKINEFERTVQNFRQKSLTTNRQIEQLKSELQSMVIKYATSEKDVLDLKKRSDDLERKYRDQLKERDQLQSKLKELNQDKKQLMQSLERQILESASLRNRNEILVNKLEQAQVQQQRLQLSFDDINNKYQSSSLQLQEIESALQTLNLVDNDDDDNVDGGDHQSSPDDNGLNNDDEPETKKQPNKWIDVYLKCTKSNHKLNEKIIELEKQIADYRLEIEQLNEKLTKSFDQLENHQKNIDLIESLKQELIKQQMVIEDLKGKFDQVSEMNHELLNEINSSKHKESELLEYTERLTAKMVTLQCEHNCLDEKNRQLQSESEQYHCDYDRIVTERNELQHRLQSIIDQQSTQIEQLDAQIESKNKNAEMLNKQIEELENNINIMKRKHILNLKELNKEIQQLRRNQQQLKEPKMLDAPSTSNKMMMSETNSSSLSSRTNSLNSLNEMIDSRQQPNNNDNDTNSNSDRLSIDTSQSSSSTTTTTTTTTTNTELTSLNDIDRNTLIERILRLQRQLIKRNEKIDFLEEHNGQLIDEMKKKSKLLQYYILKEETGALATESMDKNKAYISKRGGGIMSSLYNSSLTDDTMTLERSLEINNKLHAILEDTLLKNMTLKENLNTLALEIDRLTKLQQHQQQ